MSHENFKDISYEAHEAHYLNSLDHIDRLKNKESIDYWRHNQMYQTLLPLLSDKSSNWLTVGDGVGTDANWLLEYNENVVCSDISDVLLKKSKERGYIKEFSKENAEKLSYSDSSFDYVLCKEAYHHFPRPYIAVYEMIRVSSKAVILIEPVDIIIHMAPMLWLKNILDKFSTTLINKVWKNRSSFETVGNYVYKVSEREMEKIAAGINLPCVAFKGFNDYFTTDLDLNQPITNRKVFNKFKFRLNLKNLFSNLYLTPYMLQTSIIFKESPTQEVLNKLKEMKYKIIELPKNPYLNN